MNASDPEVFAERILGCAVVMADASSLIVLDDIAAAAAARRAWTLTTIASAADEAGPSAIGVAVVPTEIDVRSGLPTDRALVAAATKSHLPLLSEDRKVLRAAEESGIICFDVLIALEALSAKGVLSAREYADVKARLFQRNAYTDTHLYWARSVGAAAAKLC